MTCIRAGVFRSKPTVDSMFILGCSLSLAFYFYLGFKGLCVKDKSFILDVLAWSPIIGALSSQEVRRGGRTKLVRWQLLDLKLMAKESGGKVEECGQGETEIQRAKDETESPAVVGWAVPCVTPQQRHLNCFFPYEQRIAIHTLTIRTQRNVQRKCLLWMKMRRESKPTAWRGLPWSIGTLKSAWSSSNAVICEGEGKKATYY